jgi:tyrosine-protein kinase Etk/Wzc
MLANSNTPLSTPLPDKEIDLLHLVVTLLSHWKQIVALSLLSGLMALLFAMTTAPQYQADVLIQVEKKQNGLLPGGLDSLMPELSTGTASETELLRSRMILGKTVRDAGLQTVVNPVYFPVVGHAWARLTNNMVKLPTIHQYITTDPAPWVLQVVDSKHYTLTKGTTRLEGKVGQPLQDGGLTLEISALNAPAGSRFTLSRLTEQEAIQELKKNMTIGASKGDSGMIDLTMKGVSPVAIAQTLNIIAENYLQQNVARQTDKEAKSLAFLQELLAEVRTNLTEAENKLNGYRQRNDSIDLSLETKAILEQVAGVDSQLNNQETYHIPWWKPSLLNGEFVSFRTGKRTFRGTERPGQS